MVDQVHSRIEAFLAVDLGTKRTGFALWNPQLKLATPLPSEHASSFAPLLARIEQSIPAHGIRAVVVGLPLQPDGNEGEQAMFCRKFIRFVAPRLEIPVETVDERLTSKAIESAAMHAADNRHKPGQKARRRSSQKPKDIDSLSAVLIAESFAASKGYL